MLLKLRFNNQSQICEDLREVLSTEKNPKGIWLRQDFWHSNIQIGQCGQATSTTVKSSDFIQIVWAKDVGGPNGLTALEMKRVDNFMIHFGGEDLHRFDMWNKAKSGIKSNFFF